MIGNPWARPKFIVRAAAAGARAPSWKQQSMKIVKYLFLLGALPAALGLGSAGRLTAQTFTTLYEFTKANDGANPYGDPTGLILSGNTLYGTATYGGGSDNGTVFALNLDGTGATNVHSFSAVDAVTGFNNDGTEPNGLVLSGGTLYGTTVFGGSSGNGTVFAVNTNGTGFTPLHAFTATNGAAFSNADGAQPYSGLLLSNNMLYGTTTAGGSAGNGTVFALGPGGGSLTPLHSFSALDAATGSTNSDGIQPYDGLVLAGDTLYGTASYGGPGGSGTVFAVRANGTGFTNLYSFPATDSSGVNNDGAVPNGLILSGNVLYGTTYGGGTWGNGTVFALKTDGSGFTNLHTFTLTDTNIGANSDGAFPIVGLVLSGNTLYGTALFGGSAGNGTIFALNTNGAAFTNLYNFTAGDTNGFNSDGANPQAGLILSGNALYGTAYNGGSVGKGTVFKLSFLPQLTLMLSGTNAVLTWPTNVAGFSYAGYNLETTTNLGPPAVWSPVSPSPVVIDGQSVVINPMSGAQRYYRLSR